MKTRSGSSTPAEPSTDRPRARVDERVVVIGAGPAGMAAAGALGQRGLSPLVVAAAAEVGSSWRARYDGLRLNTPRAMSSLPGRPIPREMGRWVSREDFVTYLDNYARHMVPRIRLGTGVDRLERRGEGWSLATSDGDLTAGSVVIATGFDRVPTVPPWPGRDAFAGELLHSSAYRSAASFRGRHVLVVGAGTSGNEIAVQVLDAGAASVKVAIRTRQTTYAREWHGVPLIALAHARPRPPARVQDAVGRWLERAVWGDLRELGLQPPPAGIRTMVDRQGHGIAVDSGLIDAIRGGRIEVVPAVEALDGDAIVLADGRRIHADAVIAATGYRCGLEDLVGHLPGALRRDGRPAVVPAERVAAAPNLYFIGYRLPISGQFPGLRRDARAIARAVQRSPAGAIR